MFYITDTDNPRNNTYKSINLKIKSFLSSMADKTNLANLR